jgi:hypothetical protein
MQARAVVAVLEYCRNTGKIRGCVEYVSRRYCWRNQLACVLGADTDELEKP